MKKDKKTKGQEIDYDRIKKEVNQNFYNHDKLFIQLMSALNKCETIKEVVTFNELANGFKKKDAPEELTDYMSVSIKNKIAQLERRDNIDLAKLRAIHKQF